MTATSVLRARSPDAAANDLHANTTFRSNALTATVYELFVMNPGVTNASITRSLAGTRYNAPS